MTSARSEQLRIGNVLREHRARIRALEARPAGAGGGGPALTETYYAPDVSIVVGGGFTPPGLANFNISAQMYVIGHLALFNIALGIGGAGTFVPGNAPRWTITYAATDFIGQTTPLAVGGAGTSAGIGYANDFSASIATPIYTWFSSSITRSFELAWDGPGAVPLPAVGFNAPFAWGDNDTIFEAALSFVVA